MRGLWKAAAAVLVAACTDSLPLVDPPREPGDGDFEVELALVATGLSRPLFVTAAPGDDTRLFVVEQLGTVALVRDGAVAPEPYLDIRDRVSCCVGERGLLGMAFHPEYAGNGHFYVSYTDLQGDSRIERYTVSADPDRADPGSAWLVLHIEQVWENHNGGHLEFGPDRMLYVGMGDGGGAGDPFGHAQDPGTLLGAVLRIDVDGAEPYAIPPDNPFPMDGDARPEVWAYGLRNPWRFSLDEPTGLIYIADVGQGSWEEINVAPLSAGGLNFGWNVMEGSSCYLDGECESEGLTPPVVAYAHEGPCWSVTGGLVYRGTRIPGLEGHYVYSDWCRGWIRSFRMTEDGPTMERQWDVPALPWVTSFGRDGSGEIYVVSSPFDGAPGQVFRIVPR